MAAQKRSNYMYVCANICFTNCTGGSSPNESPSAPVECKLENTDATICGPGAAGLHAVKLEMR